MPRENENEDFDPTTLLGDEDHDETEAPEGEEGQDGGEGEEDESPDAGDDSEQDEAEDGEERADGLDEEGDEAPRQNAKARNSQNSWQRRESKFNADLEAERERTRRAEALLQARQEEQQREEAARQQHLNAREEERRALLTPEERQAEDIQQLRAQINYNDAIRKLEVWDSQDKAAFDAIANSDSALGRLYKKNGPAIEKHLKDIRARNTNMPRDVLLRYEIGDQVLKAMANNKPSKPQATRKVQKAPNSRGDAGRTPARSNPPSDREARKKRLENVRL